jgi:carbon storage regulator CsrA
MLVLSRKSQESVVVGGTNGFDRLLKVTVLAIQSGKVSLGFDIDASIPVFREEIWERIHSGKVANGPPTADAEGA